MISSEQQQTQQSDTDISGRSDHNITQVTATNPYRWIAWCIDIYMHHAIHTDFAVIPSCTVICTAWVVNMQENMQEKKETLVKSVLEK